MEEDEGIVLPNFSRYRVFKDGRIYSIKKKIYMIPIKDAKYQWVGLVNDDGYQVTCYIHRLLAMAFIDNPDNLPVVDHINRNHRDNSLSNLRWVTVADNNLNVDKRKGRAVTRISKDGSEVNYITIKAVSEDNDVSHTHIARLIKADREYKGYRYKYLDNGDDLQFGNEWKFCTLEGSEELEASDLGFIRSGDKILNISLSTSGYYRTSYGGNRFSLHSLVISAFIGLPSDERLVISHKDGNRLNNRLDNLSYITPSDNAMKAIKLGKGSSQPIREVDTLTGEFMTFRSSRYAAEVCNMDNWVIERSSKSNVLDSSGRFYFIREKDIRPIRRKHVKTGEITRYGTNIEVGILLDLTIDDIKFLCEDYDHSYKGYKYYYDD